MNNYFDCIKSILITEKTSRLSEKYNQLVLLSPVWVTKKKIASVIDAVFSGVEVKKVASMRTKGKVKRFRGIIGKRSDLKKFVVTLKGDVSSITSSIGGEQ